MAHRPRCRVWDLNPPLSCACPRCGSESQDRLSPYLLIAVIIWAFAGDPDEDDR